MQGDPSQSDRPQALGRFDLLSLSISLVGLVALAGAGLLYMRVGGPIQWTGFSGVILALLMIAAAALISHYVAVAMARQRQHERLVAMRTAAHELGLGDLQVEVPEGDDDLGNVGRSLNTMSWRISRLLTAQRDLLSGVSHELRSPLARISVSLELIEQDVGPKSDAHELIDGIREEVTLLERHISRLLEAQRVSRDRVLVERKVLAVDALVRRVVRRERLRLEEAGFEFQTDLRLGAGQVLGDENALDRVLSTLLENAVQYASDAVDEQGAPRTPELRVETDSDPRGALIRVLDRGPGLTADQCQRVFEPFYRTDASRNANTGGTGLGMYLARRICKAHGGQARAWPRPGGGLVVEMQLPLRGQKELKETMRVQLDSGSLMDSDDPAVDADAGLEDASP